MPVDVRNKRIKEKPNGCLSAIRAFLLATFFAVVVVVGTPFLVNGIVMATTFTDIQTEDQIVAQEKSFDADAIVVLGAGINYDGSPSTVLRDRLDVAISLYEKGVAPKIIMSGDNSQSSYNEVMAMCNYAAKQGVPRDDIFCDHAGVSTYDTAYRLHHVFSVKRCVMVSQQYHLYRCIFNAEGFGVKALGVAADAHNYKDIESYERREFAARIKDFAQVIIKAEPAKKSSPVSLDQSGRVTQWW